MSRQTVADALTALESAIEATTDVAVLSEARSRIKVLNERVKQRIALVDTVSVTVHAISGQTTSIDELRPDDSLWFLCDLVESKLNLAQWCTQLCLGDRQIQGTLDWSDRQATLRSAGIYDGAALSCTSCPAWLPIGDSASVIMQSRGEGKLVGQGVVVSAHATKSVLWKVGMQVETKDGNYANRKLSLAVGNRGVDNKYFTLIVDNDDIICSDCMGTSEIQYFGDCSHNDVVSLRFDGHSVHFENNGRECAPPRRLVLEEDEELFAYATIADGLGEMDCLVYGWTSFLFELEDHL